MGKVIFLHPIMCRTIQYGECACADCHLNKCHSLFFFSLSLYIEHSQSDNEGKIFDPIKDRRVHHCKVHHHHHQYSGKQQYRANINENWRCKGGVIQRQQNSSGNAWKLFHHHLPFFWLMSLPLSSCQFRKQMAETGQNIYGFGRNVRACIWRYGWIG